MTRSFTLSSDLGRFIAYLTVALAIASIVLLAVELRRRRSGGFSVAATGLLATLLLGLAVLRPATVLSRGSLVGPRVVVLADRSRSLDLPGDHGTRRDALVRSIQEIRKSAGQARLRVLGFGEGPAVAWDP